MKYYSIGFFLKGKKKRKTIDHKRKQCFAFLVKPSSVPVSVAKDLGIYIDQSLTYDYHITKTVSTCLQKLIQIKRIKHLIDKSALLLLLVSSLVFSELYYCSSIWSNTSKRNIKKLQLIQNFVKRTGPFFFLVKGVRLKVWMLYKQVNDNHLCCP